jgi:uncharacterized protein (TIRG00374 family)
LENYEILLINILDALAFHPKDLCEINSPVTIFNMRTFNYKSPVSLKLRVFSTPTLISFLMAAAFIYFLTHRFGVDWKQTWSNISDIHLGYYLLALSLYYLSFVFRGIRWKLLTENAAETDCSDNTNQPTIASFSQIVLMGWFVNAVTWLRLGDAYRAYALSQRSGKSFSWNLGTILAERVLDIVTVFTLLVIGTVWFSATQKSDGIEKILFAALIMAVLLSGLLFVMKSYGSHLSRLLPYRLANYYNNFEKGTITSLKRIPILSLLGIIGWMLETSRLYFVAKSIDVEVAVPLILIVSLGHAILSTFPTPGGIGAVEPGVTGLLVLGMNQHLAISVTIIDRSITLLSVIVLGGITFLLWQLVQPKTSNGNTKPADSL